MNTTEFLKQAEETLFNQLLNLKNSSNDALESDSKYCFVLCNAKISFINSLISDVRFALSGTAPDVLVESVVEAVKHVEENFNQFLGTPCETTCSTEIPTLQKEIDFLEDKPRLGDTVSFTSTDWTGTTKFSAIGLITYVEIISIDDGIVLYTITSDVGWTDPVFINNPLWPNDSIEVITRAEDEFGM